VGKPAASAHDAALAYAASSSKVSRKILGQAVDMAQSASRLGTKSVGAGRVEELIDDVLKAKP
jgi:hypothetical protein